MSPRTGALEPNGSERALRLGVVVYVLLLVALPLSGLVACGMADGLGTFWHRLMAPAARSALSITMWTALLVGVVNTVLGTATAWVLVRYAIPGKAFLSALVDLPLAMPTLVAGVMLAILYGPTSLLGSHLEALGFEVIFAKPGIVLALLFVTLPFVVRAVEPLLREIDPAEEEAATVLGASPFRTFRTVFFPAILPVALSSGVRSVGRAVGEFGSVVVVAGNIPFETVTAPVYIFGEIESGSSQTAAALSIALLAFALAVQAAVYLLEQRKTALHATR